MGFPPKWAKKAPLNFQEDKSAGAAVAGVMAMRPEVLVLDEPIAGLDPKGRREMLNLINNYHIKMGATIVLVSHNMDDVPRAAGRVIV